MAFYGWPKAKWLFIALWLLMIFERINYRNEFVFGQNKREKTIEISWREDSSKSNRDD